MIVRIATGLNSAIVPTASAAAVPCLQLIPQFPRVFFNDLKSDIIHYLVQITPISSHPPVASQITHPHPFSVYIPHSALRIYTFPRSRHPLHIAFSTAFVASADYSPFSVQYSTHIAASTPSQPPPITHLSTVQFLTVSTSSSQPPPHPTVTHNG